MTARTAFLILGIAALAALSAGDGFARSFGLGHLGLGMGKLGAAGSKGSNGTAPVGCSPLGLKFNVACNSQYLTIVH